ncbi:nicotinate-nucleotide--dimethylbenzimidazole phosphoribosyltransferase [Massilia sp. W12]|uniref:nicotinate-nucleotide--dimethylbenzimidazole phosphoribosyltransferase n=1 Tax=Massilia sp. W12 TaxID=3126507 RepID=UPI0030D2B3EB
MSAQPMPAGLWEIPARHAPALAQRLQHLIDHKTKPPGSLGQLEALALQIGLVLGTEQPRIAQPGMLVFAADHGIAEEGVSAFPQSVTWQMVENYLAGGAAVNVFARQHGCQLQVVDAGVKHEFGPRPGLLSHKIAWGSRNFAREAALTPAECEQALACGHQLAQAQPGNLLLLGEMGIANTSSAALLMHHFTQIPLAQCVGAGTGLDAAGVAHKLAVLQAALQFHGPRRDPLAVLQTFGGLEIAMLCGAMLGAAQAGKLILVDGFIVTSALLAAHALAPQILDYCIFSHCSDEAGHAAMLNFLGVQPLLKLGLRLGEGSAAALALPLLYSACAFLSEMASFDSAGVSGKLDPA